VAPGVSRTYQYNLAGSAKVKVWITSETGQVLRTLLNDAVQSAGDHSVVWDGKDGLGRQLPDGRYSINIGATNAAGAAATATWPAWIDGTGPTITVVKSTTGSTALYGVSVTDAVSGMKDFQVSLDGKSVFAGPVPRYRASVGVSVPTPGQH